MSSENGAKFLIVEDDYSNRRILRRQLMRNFPNLDESNCYEAASAAEYWEFAETISPDTRLIALLDEGLFDGSGLEVSQDLKTRFQGNEANLLEISISASPSEVFKAMVHMVKELGSADAIIPVMIAFAAGDLEQTRALVNANRGTKQESETN